MRLFRRRTPAPPEPTDHEQLLPIRQGALRDVASVLDGLCKALDDVNERSSQTAFAISAGSTSRQLRQLRAKLWPTGRSGPELYDADHEWYTELRFVFREGVPEHWEKLCQAPSAAEIDGGSYALRCLLRPGHNGKHHSRVQPGATPEEQDVRDFLWEDGQPPEQFWP